MSPSEKRDSREYKIEMAGRMEVFARQTAGYLITDIARDSLKPPASSR